MYNVFNLSLNGVMLQAYADDITAVVSASKLDKLNRIAQALVNHLSFWANKNKLNFATEKCLVTYMDFEYQSFIEWSSDDQHEPSEDFGCLYRSQAHLAEPCQICYQ